MAAMSDTRRRFLERSVLGLAGVAASHRVEAIALDGRCRRRQARDPRRDASRLRHRSRRGTRDHRRDHRGSGEAGPGAVHAGGARPGGPQLARSRSLRSTSGAPGLGAWHWSRPSLPRAAGSLPPGSRRPGRPGTRIVRSAASGGALPARDEDIAFAPVTRLSRWIEKRQLTSERLTKIYLDRLQPLRRQASTASSPSCANSRSTRRAAPTRRSRRADYRGPLHGIPCGAKDLLDTAGIPTTYGAEPFRHRVPHENAVGGGSSHTPRAACSSPSSASGALALNDIWFGGQTKNPWLLEEGSSGSSAGPGAATAAGCVAFAIGSETDGSIIGPSMRCGVTGLRPTYGRVAAHRRHDPLLVARQARPHGPRRRRHAARPPRPSAAPIPGDVDSVPSHLDFDAGRFGAPALRVGLLPRLDERAPRHRRRPRRARDGPASRHDPRRGLLPRLALRLARA